MAWTLSTDDPDALAETARPFIGDVSVERRRFGDFRGRIDAVELTRVALCRIRLRNAQVTSERRGFLGVWLPLDGTVELKTVPQRLALPAGVVAVTPGERKLAFETDGADLLVAAFGNDFVASVSQTVNGGGGDLRVGGTLPTDTAWTASFRRYLQFVWAEVSQPTPGVLTSDLVLRAYEEALLASLFFASREISIARPASDPRPHSLRRAEGYIAANLGDAISVADLSRVAGVSSSTLSRAFRTHHGCGPMAFAKRQRLDRARQELTIAEPRGATVTDVATRFGFFHLAQFAADYRKAFGEKPSETLRRG